MRWQAALVLSGVLSGCGLEQVLMPDAGVPGRVIPAAPAPVQDAGVEPSPDAGVEEPADAGVEEPVDAGVKPPPPPPPPLDTVVDVPPTGPYGTKVFTVSAGTNWVNSGLYLRTGEQAVISATGSWSVDGAVTGPAGIPARGLERGCARGSLVARSGLRYKGQLTCVGAGTTFVATRDGAVYLGMIDSPDLEEGYGSRLVLSGALEVTVTSTGKTVPSVKRADLATYPFAQVASGEVELLGQHVIVSISAAQALADRSTAQASLDTLDALYDQETALRGMTPFAGQRVRFYPDDAVVSFAYMLAGNPIRCAPEIMTGGPDQRILRASVATTDIWGFAHELGHVFSFANGTWLFQRVNLESWPNIFTLHALEKLGRTANQPNVTTYCDGKAAYLASGTYAGNLRDDPFLQLCFLMEFKQKYGWAFWESFWRGMNGQLNSDVGYDGLDDSVWTYVRNRFSLAAGVDVTPTFQQWRVPLR